MADALDATLAGEPVRLLCDRALYWPARRRLPVLQALDTGTGTPGGRT